MLSSLELLRQLEDGEIVPPTNERKVYSVFEIMQGNNHELKDHIISIQTVYNYWNEKVSHGRANMGWRTVDGKTTYHEDLTPEQEKILLNDKHNYWPGFKTKPRCVKNCITYQDCNCWPWRGIVLVKEDGHYHTEINTEISPIPQEPYIRCADCYHTAHYHYRTSYELSENPYRFKERINKAELKRMCKKCIEEKRPLTCMIFCYSYNFPGC